jgi:hypothetical protein
MNYLALVIFVLFISCNSNTNHKAGSDPRPRQLSSLSQWLIDNEDSLYFYVQKRFAIDTIQIGLLNNEGFYRDYQIKENLPGTLVSMIHNYKNCMEVYFERRALTKLPAILLSAEYDKDCVDAVDSIFNDIDSLKHFEVIRFHKPGRLFSGFEVDNDIVTPEDVSFRFIPQGDRYRMEVNFRKQISAKTNDLLLQSVFGEEVLLKRISNIKYVITKEKIPETKTIEEARILFKITD